MTRGGKRGKLKQRVSPSSHRAWKSGRPRRIPTFPQRRRRLLHRHNFQTTPQRILCSRFRDAVGDAASAGGALARAKLSAAGPGAISTAGGGSDAADSGGVLARHLDAAGGAGGSDPDGRGRERADGLEAEPPSGPFGKGVSAGAFEG